MSSYGRYYRPPLKQSVGVQLQTAFSDGNWTSVIRLADKRAKSTSDGYFEAVKVCAESQLETPAERCAAVVAVDALVRKGTPLEDLEVLELYEWACRDAQPPLEYASTFGVLRSRWVKANPRSAAGLSCLQACLQQWDLVNAQQIAAILDKSASATDRRYMYWSITLTYLLSMSPQCPEGKQKIYGMLAAKQLERAAELAESNGGQNGDRPKANGSERDMRQEEEFILYYKVLAAQNSQDEFVKRIRSPHIGALRFFNEGSKHLLFESIRTFEIWQRWDVVFEFCRSALAKTESDGSPSLLASDWRLWRSFITAATKQPDQEKAFAEVQDILQHFTSIKTKIAQMYVKNFSLALVEVAFRAPTTSMSVGPSPAQPSRRLIQLCLFLEKHFDKSSVFDDVKNYVEQLSFEEIRTLLEVILPKMVESDSEPVRATLLRVFGFKIRYFITTCPQSRAHPSAASTTLDDCQVLQFQCKTCNTVCRHICKSCLRKLSADAISTYQAVHTNASLVEQIPGMDKDPRVDLALLATLSLLKIAGIFDRHPYTVSNPFSRADLAPFLQAVVLLDFQLQKNTDDIPLRILLVQLYLLLGCGSYAYQLWAPLDVKRTIQDALSPLFFDRISSIAPGLFQGGRPLTEPLRTYYTNTLHDPAPVRIWDAFQSGSYSSIVDMTEYNDRLRRSCTRVMAAVEERRASRIFGGKLEDLDKVPIFSEIDDSTRLVNVVDHGSLPDLESSYAPSLAQSLRLGPPLSNTRAHLSLLAEEYLELITYKAPKDYKPAKPVEAAFRERTYTLETLASLHNSMTNFLHLADSPSHLTTAELSYYTILSLLAGGLLTVLTADRTTSLPTIFNLLASSLKSALSSLRSASLPPAGPSPSSPSLEELSTLHTLTDQHTLSTLRDAALALKLSASFALAHNDAQSQRDRSGRSNLHKEALAEMRGLEALGTKTLGEVRARAKGLKDKLGEPGWLDRVSEWAALGGGDSSVAGGVLGLVGGEAFVEDWAGRLLDSWREGVKGWSMMKWE